MQIIQSRRDFLASASMAAAAGVLGARRSLADEAPPETTTLRLGCSIRHLRCTRVHRRGAAARGRLHRCPLSACRSRRSMLVARGEADFDIEAAPWVVSHLDAGEPFPALAGMHPGCYELFAHDPSEASPT